MLAWGAVLTAPIQTLHDLIFNEYADGSNAFPYNNATSYVVGDEVIYTDRGVYQCIVNSTGNLPSDAAFWALISDNYIGVRERIKYSSQKLTFEFGLNRWFQATGIFITNNDSTSTTFTMGETGEFSSFMPNSDRYQKDYLTNDYLVPTTNNYTINVPVAVFDPLASNDTDRENIVRDFADKYNAAGMIYNVVKF